MIKLYKMPVNFKELKIFSLVICIFIFFIFFIWPWYSDHIIKIWPLYFIFTWNIILFFYSRLLIPVYRAWLFIGYILGYINTRLILLLIYISLIVPYGFIIKIMNKDLLSIKIKKDLDTYKVYRVKDYSYDQEYIKRPF